jgi:hypothetical protein
MSDRVSHVSHVSHAVVRKQDTVKGKAVLWIKSLGLLIAV